MDGHEWINGRATKCRVPCARGVRPGAGTEQPIGSPGWYSHHKRYSSRVLVGSLLLQEALDPFSGSRLRSGLTRNPSHNDRSLALCPIFPPSCDTKFMSCPFGRLPAHRPNTAYHFRARGDQSPTEYSLRVSLTSHAQPRSAYHG